MKITITAGLPRVTITVATGPDDAVDAPTPGLTPGPESRLTINGRAFEARVLGPAGTWDDAMRRAAAAGDGWRLPTRDELDAISRSPETARRLIDLALAPEDFIERSWDGVPLVSFWAATPSHTSATAWALHAAWGLVINEDKEHASHALLLRRDGPGAIRP